MGLAIKGGHDKFGVELGLPEGVDRGRGPREDKNVIPCSIGRIAGHDGLDKNYPVGVDGWREWSEQPANGRGCIGFQIEEFRDVKDGDDIARQINPQGPFVDGEPVFVISDQPEKVVPAF